ncbi:zinc finger CCHC domain-containing protein 2 isoform X2 [Salmo salar]|uniref:Zinc finger CCHC domain-containing protein 2 isoform X2 n=1 Tax=Salmo salar TaxID=8030 RepID=A0A1S3LYR9_SALSA|nr:zinc finger CCHC domain-containing protein 2-like isoform X2 [Salmo salar]|eukprot:XP_013995829.1 PREDICTED: zinc finger CCHC domain-containing protein 2-like isoform X2 [Salmo salar]
MKTSHQAGAPGLQQCHLPLFHLPSMCSTGYPSHHSQVQHQSHATTQLPFYPPPPHTATSTPPPRHSHHMLATQAGYNLQQMTAAPFNSFYMPMFSLGLGTGTMKSSANVSCYNCGLSGHYAQDCKQPSMDAWQQGDFRLKYTDPHSFEADQTDGHERGPRQCFVSHYSKDSRKCFHGLSFSPIVLLCKYADLFLCREWNPVSFSDFSEDGGILHWRQVQDRLTFSD